MITEEQMTEKRNCRNCAYLGTTNCPDVLLMDNLDLDSYSCTRWKPSKKEEEE